MRNSEIINGLEPQLVFNYFAEISDIARGSGNTTKIADYLVNFAKDKNLKFLRDRDNNVIIRKKSNNPNKTTIALQAHTDMVCVKTSSCNKNMNVDGIDFCIDGEYLKAKDTTLGADDGIGIAMILSILNSKEDYNRDIVGLFTVDEEIGMNGATSIDLSSIKDVINFINIDNEEYNVFDVGSAGGTHLEYIKEYNLIELENQNLFTLSIDGCLGGHSGTEITKNRLNANKFMICILKQLKSKFDILIENLNGGNYDNAIPDSCVCSFIIKDTIDLETIKNIIDDELKEVYKEYPNEINLKYNLEVAKKNKQSFFNADDTKDIINMFDKLPDGLIERFDKFPNIAKTSLNLGIIKCENNNKISFTYLVRSNINEERTKLIKKIDDIATSYFYINSNNNSYPAWEYKKSELEDSAVNIFERLYGENPVIEITHGGLECGILLQKIPNANAIAVGPTILGAHTTEEKLKIKTVKIIYDFIIEIIKYIK